MLKIIWMSDLHFVQQGNVLGHDPRVRMRAAISHVNEHHADAAFCVISGDLVNHVAIADYTALQTELAALTIPYMPMMGNHDDRDLLRETLPLPDNCMEGFVQYAMQTSEGVVACLDTHRAGSAAGEFCKARTAWLERLLAEAGDQPVFLFMHHPPMALGLPMQDIDRMQNGDAFLDPICAASCVRYMFIGHIHRPISGVVRGVPFATMRSVLLQAPAPHPDWNWDTFQPSREAPNFGIIEISQDSVIMSYEQFCEYDVGTSSR